MKESRNRKNNLKNILRVFMLILCGAILGLNIYMANANRLVGNKMPMPFGYGMAVVLSGSMEPTFSEGDLIIVKESQEYEVDDIIVFQEGKDLIVHRIIEKDGDTIVTQGDANGVSDEPIEVGVVKGKVLFWIPFFGMFVNLLKTPIGTIGIIVAAIALIEIPRRREKEKDDEERQKILDEIRRLKDEI